MTNTTQLSRQATFVKSDWRNAFEVTNWQYDNSLLAIVRATFPTYKRKKITIRPSESVQFQDLNWSGGTRCEYRSCTVDGQQLGSMDRYHSFAPWDVRQVEGQSIDIPAGAIVVRGGYFCGKESVLELNVHPADMPKYLPAVS